LSIARNSEYKPEIQYVPARNSRRFYEIFSISFYGGAVGGADLSSRDSESRSRRGIVILRRSDCLIRWSMKRIESCIKNFCKKI